MGPTAGSWPPVYSTAARSPSTGIKFAIVSSGISQGGLTLEQPIGLSLVHSLVALQ